MGSDHTGVDCSFSAAARKFHNHADRLSRSLRIQPSRSRARLYDAERTGRTCRANSPQTSRGIDSRIGGSVALPYAMEIPYTISTRPDTGLWNAKIGIWLFLASEVMLFGALFSAYIFLRIDASP